MLFVRVCHHWLLPCGIVVTGREHSVECSDGSSIQESFVVEPGRCLHGAIKTVTYTLSSRLTPVMIWYALAADEFIKEIIASSMGQVSLI